MPDLGGGAAYLALLVSALSLLSTWHSNRKRLPAQNDADMARAESDRASALHVFSDELKAARLQLTEVLKQLDEARREVERLRRFIANAVHSAAGRGLTFTERGFLHTTRGVVVLVLEPAQEAADMLLEALEDRGYEAALASTHDEALSLAGKLTVGVCLLDLYLSGGHTSLATARALRALPGGGPHLIVCTAARAGDLRADALISQIAPSAVVRKPYELDALLQAVDSLAAAVAA
jgi:CheY-like chemotaxis protein